MNQQEWTKVLQDEGYKDIYVRRDGAGVFYPDHTHPVKVAHVVLEGEMALVSDGKEMVLHAGDRFDIPAGTVHSATMGKEGCAYLIGE